MEKAENDGNNDQKKKENREIYYLYIYMIHICIFDIYIYICDIYIYFIYIYI